MNIERFTISASKRLQEAQNNAITNSNSIFESVHLLDAILNANESINLEILKRMNVNTENLLLRTQDLINKLPKIT